MAPRRNGGHAVPPVRPRPHLDVGSLEGHRRVGNRLSLRLIGDQAAEHGGAGQRRVGRRGAAIGHVGRNGLRRVAFRGNFHLHVLLTARQRFQAEMPFMVRGGPRLAANHVDGCSRNRGRPVECFGDHTALQRCAADKPDGQRLGAGNPRRGPIFVAGQFGADFRLGFRRGELETPVRARQVRGLAALDRDADSGKRLVRVAIEHLSGNHDGSMRPGRMPAAGREDDIELRFLVAVHFRGEHALLIPRRSDLHLDIPGGKQVQMEMALRIGPHRPRRGGDRDLGPRHGQAFRSGSHDLARKQGRGRSKPAIRGYAGDKQQQQQQHGGHQTDDAATVRTVVRGIHHDLLGKQFKMLRSRRCRDH